MDPSPQIVVIDGIGRTNSLDNKKGVERASSLASAATRKIRFACWNQTIDQLCLLDPYLQINRATWQPTWQPLLCLCAASREFQPGFTGDIHDILQKSIGNWNARNPSFLATKANRAVLNMRTNSMKNGKEDSLESDVLLCW